MSEEFSPGVKIILERMRDFPEEFILRNEKRYHIHPEGGRPTWYELARHVTTEHETFTPAERDAVNRAWVGVKRAEFDATVMDLLAGKPEPEPENKKLLINRAQLDIMQKMTNTEFNKQYAASLATGLGLAVQKQKGNSI